MLKVTVELFPGGDAGRRRSLGTMNIANCSDLADVSDYRIAGSEAANRLNDAPAWTAEAEVNGHDRRQSVWRLVAAAATAIESAEKVDW